MIQKIKRRRKNNRKVLHNIVMGAIVLASVCAALYFGNTQPMASVLGGDGKLPMLDAQDPFDAVFLDVGQGHCAVVMSKGKVALIDTGERGQHINVLRDLRAMGVERIDVVIGSHAHTDHVGALDEILQAMPVGEIYMPAQGRDQAVAADILAAANEQGIEDVLTPQYGQQLALGDVTLTLYGHPHSDDLNEGSIVVMVQADGVSMLLSGDIGRPGEAYLLDMGVLERVDVLQVPHHGSANSSTRAFIEVLWPQYAVIQSGADNSYGHPAATTLRTLYAYGMYVLRQDECGNIYVDVDESGQCVVDTQYPAVQPYATQKEAA